MLGTPVPVVCPKCGSAETARIEWGATAVCHGLWQGKVDGVRVVVGGQKRPLVSPDWTCLKCEPGWSEVHRLALLQQNAQDAMVDALAAEKIESALRARDVRDRITQRLQEVIGGILEEKTGDAGKNPNEEGNQRLEDRSEASQ